MPHAVKMQVEHGDDLQVVFVESQLTPLDEMHGFAIDHKWFGNNAMWTLERPFESGMDGLPSYVLLGADGKVIEKGGQPSSKTEELIANEIERAKEAPEGTPKKLESAWKAFAKGDVAKAIDSAKKALADPELATAAQGAIDTFIARTNARIDRAKWALDNGHIVAAIERLESIEGAVKGSEELEPRVAELLARAEGDELKAEREADEKLAKFLEGLYEEGFDSKGKMRKKLEKIAADLGDTKAGERARHILAIAPAD